jgi:hypothetical protein
MDAMAKVLSVIQLSKKYRDIIAADGISFDVGHNEIVGLLSPNVAHAYPCGAHGPHRPLQRRNRELTAMTWCDAILPAVSNGRSPYPRENRSARQYASRMDPPPCMP